MAEYFSGERVLGGKRMHWESVFPKGTQYGCERCGVCCTKLDLTQRDIDALKKNGFGKCISYKDPRTASSASKASLCLQPSGFCWFLNEERLCDIYDIRPLVCRSYPLMPTPGFDGEIIVDIAMKCPYVGADELEIKESDIIERIDSYIDYVPEMIPRALAYRQSLADHIRAAYPAAFMRRQEKTPFMDDAINLLDKVKGTADIIGTLRDWCDKISVSSHNVIARGNNGVYGQKQDKEILSRMPGVETDHAYAFSKERWRNVISDIGGTVFLPAELGIKVSGVKVGFRARIGNKSYGWGTLKELEYSRGALDELREYMKILVRRSGFQLSIAYLAEYLIDFKKAIVVDYSLETIILANAMAVYVDPISRISAVASGHDKIEGSDLRMGISNIDAPFISALTNGTIVSEFVKKLDRFPATG